MLTVNQRDLLAAIVTYDFIVRINDLDMNMEDVIHIYETSRKVIEEKDILRGNENEGSSTDKLD